MSKFTLRPYQKTAVDQVLYDLRTHDKVSVISPTGSGKSAMFIALTERYCENNPGRSVLILSHLSLLTTQTREKFSQQCPYLRVGVLQADQMPDPRDQVIISTMQSSRNQYKVDHFKNLSNYQIGLVVVDEAHFLYTDSYEMVLSYLPGAKIVGFTATPFRSGAVMTGWFDKISFSISLQEMIDMGYLVPPKLITIKQRTKDTEEVVAFIASLYQQYEKDKKAIIYMKTIEDAKLMAMALQAANINSRAITSELGGMSRDSLLEEFKSHSVDVLTTVNVLTAGFDAPAVEAIFMPYATKSPTLYMQRIGRGLRTSPGKESCRIYVCGSAPSISSKAYEKLQMKVLHAKGDINEFDTYEEDLNYNDYEKGSEIYHWTKTVCSVVRKMEKLGMNHFADQLLHKDFPRRYLNRIEDILKNLPRKADNPSKNPMSDRQRAILKEHGFSDECLSSGISKREAAYMIGAIFDTNGTENLSEYKVMSGKFEGKHVSQLPHHYRQLILQKYPNSNIAQLIRKWRKRHE